MNIGENLQCGWWCPSHKHGQQKWLEGSSASVFGYMAHGGNGTVVKNDRCNRKRRRVLLYLAQAAVHVSP